MRVPSVHRRSDISENMMTSMIDVVFLLLIFFVCAAVGAVSESLLPVDLPSGSAGSTVVKPASVVPVDEVWIRLTHRPPGQLVMQLNGTNYETHAELRGVLLALADLVPGNPVILDIAPEVPAGEMIRVYDTCRSAKFTNVQFHVKQPLQLRTKPRTQ